eukprot:420285-Prymnesium_polylepis.1
MKSVEPTQHLLRDADGVNGRNRHPDLQKCDGDFDLGDKANALNSLLGRFHGAAADLIAKLGHSKHKCKTHKENAASYTHCDGEIWAFPAASFVKEVAVGTQLTPARRHTTQARH